MTPLRIGLVSHSALGGSGVVAAQLARELADVGHQTHLLSRGEPPRHVQGPNGPIFHRVEPPPYPVFDQPPLTVAMACAMARWIDDAELDVLHVHYAVPYAVSARLALEMATRTPRLVVTLHGTDVTGVGRDPLYAPATRLALRHAQVVTTPSRALAEAAREALALPDGLAVTVVPNFVDAHRFRPATRSARAHGPTLVHMSNFRPVKRTSVLVELLARVREHVDARMLLIGDGPERRALAEAFARAGLGRQVRFLGMVQDPAPWLREGDVFVLPSAMESFGLSALEAMASGLPVVASRVGGVPEVVDDGVTGLLVEPESTVAFAEAATALLLSRERREAMAHAGRARAVRLFSPQRAVAAYLETYGAAPLRDHASSAG
jgi:L-malate glycosyltransferase